MSQLLRSLVAIVVFCTLLGYVGTARSAGTDPKATPTHKQLRTIKPKHGDRELTLWMFCLGPGGDLWTSVSDESRYQPIGPDGQALGLRGAAYHAIQVYDADGKLKFEYPLPFVASAINFAPDGTLFVAGHGKLARLSAAGEILLEGTAPNIGNLDEFKVKIVAQAKKEREANVKNFSKQLETITKNLEKKVERIDQLEEELKDLKDAELTKQETRIRSEKTQKQVLITQKRQMESIVKNFESRPISAEQSLQQYLTIPAIAATSDNLFVVTSALNGRGYEVWRTNHQFLEGEVVKRDLMGCCGNMDIQSRDAGFVACENTRFRLTAYDREGKEQASFGKRDRTLASGFGSCCNPMNCLTLSNGDYLVAESSIGNIKRFNTSGEFLGIVGKARISGNCKHVSLGYDESRNRYYMLNQDKNHICVLVPRSEAPELTEEERMAKDAKEGLGKKIVGRWQLENKDDKQESSKNDAYSSLLRGQKWNRVTEVEFLQDETIKINGSIYQRLGNAALSWECIGQQVDRLQFSILSDGVEFETLSVNFKGDDQIQFNGGSYLPSDSTFERVKPSAAAATPDEKAAAANK